MDEICTFIEEKASCVAAVHILFKSVTQKISAAGTIGIVNEMSKEIHSSA